MATAKERGHKDWGYGGVVRRDFRADKGDGDHIGVRDYGKRWYSNSKRHAPKRKKDTNRWCKGVVDREHIWTLFKKFDFGNWWEYKCVNCSKEAWGRPKHGFFRKTSYRSNNEYDLIPMSEFSN